MSVSVVYDTMVFFQAASRPDRTHRTFRAIHENQVTLILSHDLLAEIEDVLNRESIRAKFPALTSDGVKIFIADVLAQCSIIEKVPQAFHWPEHPDDDHVFNLAIHAKAKYLVTWEARILKLAREKTAADELLRQLAPDLAIVTRKELADLLKPPEKST